MRNDGKALETFVRKVEESISGNSITVESNIHKYDESGAQIAEFDLIVTGKVGSTDLRVLIECRDRPSEGPAPSSWIEQMVGRKQIHGFNQVVAVSTTGFSAGARTHASKWNIELREVIHFDPQEIGSWIGGGIRIIHRELKVGQIDAKLAIRPGSPEIVSTALSELISSKKGRGQILITPRGGPRFSVHEVWQNYSRKQLGDAGTWDISAPISVVVDFEREGLDIRVLTRKGLAFITSISFTAQDFTWVEQTLDSIGIRYSSADSGNPIAESVKYSLPSGTDDFAIEFRRTY